MMSTSSASSSSSSSSSSSKASSSTVVTAKCIVDRTVVNEDSIDEMTDMGLSFLANLCGRNRGAFVLPSDSGVDNAIGNTYGCTAFPDNFAELAGVTTNVPLPDANAIVETWQNQNVTVADTVNLLDYLNRVVYSSTGIGVADDPYACNTAGLATLQCDSSVAAAETTNIPTIRAVTTAGLFVPAPFVLPKHKSKLTTAERQTFYTQQDFEEMAALGLNTVQIPFPLKAFVNDTHNLVPDLTNVLDWVQAAGLQALLALDGAPSDTAITAAAEFCDANGVMGMTVPSLKSVAAARAVSDDLKLFLPVNQGDVKDLVNEESDPNLFGALDMSHNGGVGNVASSNSGEDRSKLFYHEAVSCIARSPLEYAACYKGLPLLVSSGFDLAIDDCVNRFGTANTKDYTFMDYGQCDRFNETVDSAWWEAHRQSFAARQMFAYEQGLGWSFAAWKLYGTTTVGIIDDFAKLLSFQDVAAAGLMPSLTKGNDEDSLASACLNPPQPDFVMGDATYAPTAAPVDCGDGWWNETIQDCTYWIPPVTDAPTACPTYECEGGSSCSLSDTMVTTGVGTVVGLLVGLFVGSKFLGRGRAGYEEIPSHYS